jgi:hypothetical protein
MILGNMLKNPMLHQVIHKIWYYTVNGAVVYV